MAMFIFLLLSHLAVFQAFAQEITWTPKESMPIPRIDFGVAAVNNKIYVVGGYSGSLLSRVDEYDPLPGIWTRKADMPSPRRLLAVTAANGKIYAIGGWTFTADFCGGQYVYATEEFDPQTNTWSTKSDFPMRRPPNSCASNVSIGAGSAKGKIYVFIFNTQEPGTVATYEYDPAEDLWDTGKSPVPFNYTQYAVASLNDKIYVLGSGDNGVPISQYDPSQDLWIIWPSSNKGRQLLGLAAINSGLYAIGGQERSSYPMITSAVVERFDLSSKIWEYATSMPTPRFSMGYCSLGEKIYVLGGAANDSTPLSVVEEGVLPLPEDIVAHAGSDQIVFESIVLDASQTINPNNVELSYLWQINHDENSAYNRVAEGETVTLHGLERGFYNVTLRVEDTEGAVDTDNMFFSAVGLEGDFDGDGDVDGFDLKSFRVNYGIGTDLPLFD